MLLRKWLIQRLPILGAVFLVALLFVAFRPAATVDAAREVSWYTPNGRVFTHEDGALTSAEYSASGLGLYFESPTRVGSDLAGVSAAYFLENHNNPDNYEVSAFSEATVLKLGRTFYFYPARKNASGGFEAAPTTVINGSTVCTGYIAVSLAETSTIYLLEATQGTGSDGSVTCSREDVPDRRITVRAGSIVSFQLDEALAGLFIPLAWLDANSIQVWGGPVLSTGALSASQEAAIRSLPWQKANLGAFFTDEEKSQLSIFTSASCVQVMSGWDGPVEGLRGRFAMVAVDPTDTSNAWVFDYADNSRMVRQWPSDDDEVECLWGSRNRVRHTNDGRVAIAMAWNIDPDTRDEQPVINDQFSGSGIPSVSCEAESVLGWIVCPVIRGLDSATGALYRVVQGELSVFTDSQTGRVIEFDNDIKPVWEGFRNLARSLLVVALIIIIYSQLAGSSVVDAYNVRKMLPKLVIAIVGIELSWFIFTEMAILVEDISRGIPDLALSALSADGSVPQIALRVDNATGITGGVFLIMAAAAPALLIGLAPMALGVFLALLVAFFILVLRRMILVVLLVLAPIALVLWVIPGTHKLYGKWFQTFQNLLFMYPLIILLVTAGVIFSQIGGDQAIESDMPLSGVIQVMTAIIAFFAPYFLIPLTFKWAGGAVAGVAGFVNNKQKGIVDRARGAAQVRKDAARAQSSADRLDRLGRPMNRTLGGRLRRGLDLTRTGRVIPAVRRGERARRAKQNLEARKYSHDVNTLDQQARMLDLQQEEQATKIAEFDMQNRVNGMDYDAGNAHLNTVLRGEGSTFAERSAAMRLLTKRGDPGLRMVRDYVDHSAAGVAPAGAAPLAPEAIAARLRLVNSNQETLDSPAPDLTRPTATPDDRLRIINKSPEKFAGYEGSTHTVLVDSHVNDAQTLNEYVASVVRTFNEAPANLDTTKANHIVNEVLRRVNEIEATSPGFSSDTAVSNALGELWSAQLRLAAGRKAPPA